MTISATGNIYITNHITYEENPVSNPDAPNMLGIFSSNGKSTWARTRRATWR